MNRDKISRGLSGTLRASTGLADPPDSRPVRWPCPRLWAVLLPGLFLWCSSVAYAQQIGLPDLSKAVVGVGIWTAVGEINFDAVRDSASNEVKGYTAVLPSRVQGAGFGIGLSFGIWGVNFGFDQGEADIGKFADVNQTPGNAGDDPFVEKVRRTNRALVVLYQPVRWFYAGVGRDTGKMEFKQISAAGAKETKSIGYENDYYSLGLAIGFDPATSVTAPFVTAFTKIPMERGDFSGTVSGIGVGLFF